MPVASLHWWLHTDAGLLARIAIGVTIFLLLALLDVRRNGPRATRWREYLFLLYAAGMALAFGLVNDQITATISWEFFYYGKGLENVLGPATPPAPLPFRIEVAKIGLKSAWSAGLILGVAMLFANNPRPNLSQVSYRVLCRLLPKLLVFPILAAILLGVLGYAGLFAHVSATFRDLARQDLFRPTRFMAVAGIHLGAYLGALAALFVAIAAIRRQRRALALANSQAAATRPTMSLP